MKIMTFVLLLAIVLSACAPAPTPTATLVPPTATLVPPTATLVPPTVPPAPTLAAFENKLVYDMPEMYQVQTKTLQFPTLHQPPELLTMDVYYPPAWQPGSRLPAVLMANESPLSQCGRNCVVFPSWGHLIAANGLIAVTYDTKYVNDLDAVAEYVRAHSAELGVNGDRLGVMGASSHGLLAGSFVYQPNRDYVKFLVLYYSDSFTPDNFMRAENDALEKQGGGYGSELPDVKQLRTDLPVLLVRCGQDDSGTNQRIDHFVQVAKEAGEPVTLIRFDEGSHGFDFSQVTSGSLVGKAQQIIQQTLEFMKKYGSGN